MRLTKEQIAAFIDAVNHYADNSELELRLYGSRVKDELKGGDIDLLLITASEANTKILKDNKYKMLSAIKQKIGEQKIDLTIITRANITSDPFIKTAYSQSILLHAWE